jgi:hypothetical protein
LNAAIGCKLTSQSNIIEAGADLHFLFDVTYKDRRLISIYNITPTPGQFVR